MCNIHFKNCSQFIVMISVLKRAVIEIFIVVIFRKNVTMYTLDIFR